MKFGESPKRDAEASAPPIEDEPFLQAYISRNDTAALLELTSSGVRHFEKSWLTVKRLIGRTTYYHRKQVDDLLMTRKEEKMGLCFDAFRAGMKPTEVVAKYSLYPPMVERSWNLFLRMGPQENKLLIDLGALNSEQWKKVFRFPENQPIDGALLRSALELICQNPALLEKCLRTATHLRKTSPQHKGAGDEP